MPAPGRIFAGDEELGKKDDDHRPANGTIPMPAWSWTRWKATPRVRKRRVIAGVLIGIFLFFFFKNIPTDLGPIAQRIDTRIPGQTYNGSPLGRPRTHPQAPRGAAPYPEEQPESTKHYYNGQLKFYNLAVSLHAIANTMGYKELNKNVLFAASNLKSASRLIPMACEMSKWNRNVVHFAIMGREDLPMEDIQTVNGVTTTDCDIFWHDARPDYSTWSSDMRMEASVAAALGHLHTFMHPQVFLIDNAASEEVWFTRQVRGTAYDTGKSVIELPANAAQRVVWITRLGYESLKAWSNVYVDILIQAPSGSSASLIRLLRSIENADYFGARRPHLTIELPTDIDPPTQRFVENLVWPPIEPLENKHVSQVTLRHRLSRKTATEEEASIAFVESFHSARPKDSHVLVLSPQVELSPLYYHYLLYNLLEYRYSSYGFGLFEPEQLIGMSLDLPSHHLNGSKAFDPPHLKTPVTEEESLREQQVASPFLWQAPNSNAALYFGDSWAEFHSFLATRLAKPYRNRIFHSKYISTDFPAWTEYLLELMRARGYALLYPNLPASQALATVHNELYQPPEEHSTAKPSTPLEREPPPLNLDEPFIDVPDMAPFTRQDPEPPLLDNPLTTILPNEGDLPELSSLPYLSYSGDMLSPRVAQEQTLDYFEDFIAKVGGCSSNSKNIPPAIKLMSADDLFCYNEADDLPEEVPTIKVGSSEVPTTTEWTIPTGTGERPETTLEFLAHLRRQARRMGR